MFENPRRGRQARNFTTNVPKILDLKSSSEQIFSRKLSLGAPDSSRQGHSTSDFGKMSVRKEGGLEFSNIQTLAFEFRTTSLRRIKIFDHFLNRFPRCFGKVAKSA